MILVDSSVWIDHLRRRNPRLIELLESDRVLCHPFVIGELACGRLHRRAEILSLLGALPRLEAVEQQEALDFIEAHRLMGTGLGWVDVHILASSVLARAPLWTLDRRLAEASQVLGLRY